MALGEVGVMPLSYWLQIAEDFFFESHSFFIMKQITISEIFYIKVEILNVVKFHMVKLLEFWIGG